MWDSVLLALKITLPPFSIWETKAFPLWSACLQFSTFLIFQKFRTFTNRPPLYSKTLSIILYLGAIVLVGFRMTLVIKCAYGCFLWMCISECLRVCVYKCQCVFMEMLHIWGNSRGPFHHPLRLSVESILLMHFLSLKAKLLMITCSHILT